jgi:hypothetical protein
LQQKGNHGVLNPSKTLSSRFQTLSQVAAGGTAPGNASTKPEQTAGARDPRGGRKTTFPGQSGRNKQSRIVLLAPLPEERKPAIGSQACNALIPHGVMIY